LNLQEAVESMADNDHPDFKRLLEKKRDAAELTRSEVKVAIESYLDNVVDDRQMAAFLMAMFLNGLTIDETVALTEVMIDSGEVFQWEGKTPVVDKHSTGGVGDKVSLILVPMLASCGVRVPMLSGRGLGLTGGTLDKLEAIGGFRTELSADELARQVNRIGCVIAGTTSEIVPADRRLYELRNFTSTIESPGLITSSILSKKAAEGIGSLVVDVKYGSGSFMKSEDAARNLADWLVTVGSGIGLTVQTIVSEMNQPLGVAVGNGLEVRETLQILDGSGDEKTLQLTCELGAMLLVSAGVSTSLQDATALLRSTIADGSARKKFGELVVEQGGDLNRLSIADRTHAIHATAPGTLKIDAGAIGKAVRKLGAGRSNPGDVIHHGVGVELLRQGGDTVAIDDPVLRIYHDAELAPHLLTLFEESVSIT
jgi:pyrimidine-nucleoside phosphorylase